MLRLDIHAIDGAARAGEMTTRHGRVATPAFMPVGTHGSVKGLSVDDLIVTGSDCILGNTYHLYLRPGHELISRHGGLPAYTGWKRPMLTDSGGYQVFSLRDIAQIDDDGVTFQSHLDGSTHRFTPERVIEIQHALSPSIIMAFDECSPYPCERVNAEIAVNRTSHWLSRCVAEHARQLTDADTGPALFGIVQGSILADLRERSAAEVTDYDLPGFAIGGLSVGEPVEVMEEMLAVTTPLLPEDRPRYLMGVGYPDNLVMAVGYGIDMFDCVLPTRSARTGLVFTSTGPLVYRNAEYADDDRPLDPDCDCRVCQLHSRAYLRHLYKQNEITGIVLATYHNVWFYQDLMRQIRGAITAHEFTRFATEFLSTYRSGEQR